MARIAYVGGAALRVDAVEALLLDEKVLRIFLSGGAKIELTSVSPAEAANLFLNLRKQMEVS